VLAAKNEKDRIKFISIIKKIMILKMNAREKDYRTYGKFEEIEFVATVSGLRGDRDWTNSSKPKLLLF
jgi:hypothetical protein